MDGLAGGTFAVGAVSAANKAADGASEPRSVLWETVFDFTDFMVFVL